MKKSKTGEKVKKVKEKKVALTLLDFRRTGDPDHSLEIHKVRNSVEFRVGDNLTEEEVKTLLERDNFTINLKSD